MGSPRRGFASKVLDDEVEVTDNGQRGPKLPAARTWVGFDLSGHSESSEIPKQGFDIREMELADVTPGAVHQCPQACS